LRGAIWQSLSEKSPLALLYFMQSDRVQEDLKSRISEY
jgi:hypothetical protein